MADNVAVTAGSGTTIAADDVGGVLHQRVKISQGADGSATDVSSAAPLQVTLANTGANATPVVVDLGANNDVTVTSGSIAATNAGTFVVQENGSALTALQLIDDVVYVDDTATHSTGSSKGVGIMAAATPTDGSVSANDIGMVAMSTDRALHVAVQGTATVANAGTFAVQDANVLAAIEGTVAHDDPVSQNPSLVAGYASAAAPTSVSADGDLVRFWALRNGAQATVLTAAGALIGGDATNGLDVDVTRLSVEVVDDAAFTPATSKVAMVGFQADEGSTDSVDEGDGGAARMTLDRKIIVNPQPHTAGGLSIFRSLDLDETEEDVKTSAGCLYKLRISNFATSARYVKLYNNTAANIAVGSDTPIDTIPVPPASAAGNPTVITEAFGGMGLAFGTALCMAATTALADADTGAPAANDVVVSAYYK
jgi:hypothetical protein